MMLLLLEAAAVAPVDLQESVSCYSAEVAAAAAVVEYQPVESAPVAVPGRPPGLADILMFVHLLSGLSGVAVHLAGGQSVAVHLHCSLAAPVSEEFRTHFESELD